MVSYVFCRNVQDDITEVFKLIIIKKQQSCFISFIEMPEDETDGKGVP